MLAPELRVSQWFNTPEPLNLAALRGKVVALHAFQMLCPGCVSHGLPQMKRIAAAFDPDELIVIGLHTVFEHHDVMTPRALEAFIHENRLSFPIGVDEPAVGHRIPLTMHAYQMQGTPNLILIDRRGAVRLHEFGAFPDINVGAAIGRLLAE